MSGIKTAKYQTIKVITVYENFTRADVLEYIDRLCYQPDLKNVFNREKFLSGEEVEFTSKDPTSDSIATTVYVLEEQPRKVET